MSNLWLPVVHPSFYKNQSNNFKITQGSVTLPRCHTVAYNYKIKIMLETGYYNLTNT